MARVSQYPIELSSAICDRFESLSQTIRRIGSLRNSGKQGNNEGSKY
jgi:hypothetical protein